MGVAALLTFKYQSMGKFVKGAHVAPVVAQSATVNAVDNFLARAALDATEQETATQEEQPQAEQQEHEAQIIQFTPPPAPVRDVAELIEHFKRKNELIRKRNVFADTLIKLQDCEKLMHEDDQAFETNRQGYYITFEANRNSILRISNPALIIDFIAFMTDAVNKRVAVLESEILAD